MFDLPKIEMFLESKNLGTRSIYRAGLLSFQEFYKPQGFIADFLDRLEADRNKGWRQTDNVSTTVIGNFVTWLKETKKFKRKTIRVYVGSVQQLASYCHLPFSTIGTHLPASNPDLKKYDWTVSEVVRFFNLFDSKMYRSFGVLIFQSFLDCSTALSLEYRDIQKEYESKTVPLCLAVERIKTDIPFVSFIGQWGVKELHEWLNTRGELQPDDPLFPTTKQAICDYFRKKAEVFLGKKFDKGERTTCGTHSLRASGSTLARDGLKGDAEHTRAADRYIDFFMGKTIPEQTRVYMSKGRDSWRETWHNTVERFVTPNTF